VTVAGETLRTPRSWNPPIGMVAVGATAASIVGAFVGLDPLYGVGLAILALFAAIVCVRPEFATLLVVAILYSNAAAVAVKQHGVPLVIGALAPMLLLAPVTYLIFIKRQPFVFSPILPWMLAFMGANVVSAMFARDEHAAMSELYTLAIEGLGLFILITNAVRDSKTLRRAIWLMVIVGGLLAGLSVLQQITKTYGDSYLGFAQVTTNNPGFITSEAGFHVTTQKRLGGPLGDENRYAQILLMLVPLAVYLTLGSKRPKRRLVAGCALALIMAGIVLTFSRGAALGFIVVIALMLCFKTIRLRHALLVACAIGVIVSAVPYYTTRLSTFATVSSLTDATSSEDRAGVSLRSRSTENLVAALIFVDHPLLGIGPGMYPTTYQLYADRVQDFSSQLDVRLKFTRRQPHNMYLGMLAELGALGLATFIGLVVATMRLLLRARRRALSVGRNDLASLTIAMLLAVCSYLVTGAFLQLSYARYFFLVLALAATAGSVVLSELRQHREPASGEAAVPQPAT
jgi:O-antigen ligase